MKWTVNFGPTGNPLTDAHATAFESVAHLYDGQHPGRVDTYKQRAASIESQFTTEHRSRLVSALTEYLRRINAGEAAIQQATRLLRPDAVAVVTGQQSGLFTGPLYVFYKAWSAVGLARRLEADLGRPVVPVFWIASEDHDWAEVNHTYVLNSRDEVCRIQLPQAAHPHRMVYHTPVELESYELVMQAVYETLPESEDKAQIVAFLQDTWQQGDSLSTWFAKMLTALTHETGLVLLDPCLPGLRELVMPVWQKAIAARHEIAAELEVAYREVESAGFRHEVVRDPANTTLFYVVDGCRFVLERVGGDALGARSLGVEQPIESWLEMCTADPQAFSSNVLLRPVVQDHLIPTLLYVGGPSEVAYFPLSRGVFHAFDRQLPPVLLRQRVTVYPPSVERNMAKWNISMSKVAKPVDLVSPVLDSLGGDAVRDTFARMRIEAENRWAQWSKANESLGPQVRDMADAQLRRDLEGLHRLERKTLNLLAQRHDAEVSQLRHIERWLWTDGHAQERRLSLLALWSRCGLQWLRELPKWGDYDSGPAVYHVTWTASGE